MVVVLSAVLCIKNHDKKPGLYAYADFRKIPSFVDSTITVNREQLSGCRVKIEGLVGNYRYWAEGYRLKEKKIP